MFDVKLPGHNVEKCGSWIFCVSLLVKVSQGRSRMAPRKQVNKDAADVPCGSQQVEENTQEDERDDNVETFELLTVWDMSVHTRAEHRNEIAEPGLFFSFRTSSHHHFCHVCHQEKNARLRERTDPDPKVQNVTCTDSKLWLFYTRNNSDFRTFK